MSEQATLDTLDMDLGPNGDGFATVQVLDSYREAVEREGEDRYISRAKEYHEHALNDFPELAGDEITIGWHTPDMDDTGSVARADPYNRVIYLKADQPVSMVTVYHEIAHLAIRDRLRGGEDIPETSEAFCSIVAVARMPILYIDEDRIPYLGEPSVPKADWPDICERALAYREERGPSSHYIQRCKEWLGVIENDD